MRKVVGLVVGIPLILAAPYMGLMGYLEGAGTAPLLWSLILLPIPVLAGLRIGRRL